MIVFRIPATEELVYDPTLGDYDRERAARALADIAANLAIEYVDFGRDALLLPGAYFSVDGHLTADGNVLTAAWLFDKTLTRWENLAATCDTGRITMLLSS